MNELLSDLGEFRLINEVVIPTLREHLPDDSIGDDCFFLDLPRDSATLVVTTDVGPKPLVWAIGSECYRTWGWYAVVANMSDLASAGADPLAFTSSVEAPDAMPVSMVRDFFAGVGEACRAFGLAAAGGNVRNAPRFECHGTAIGVVPRHAGIGRAGALPGDHIVVIGDCGRFVCDFLRARAEGLAALGEDSPLFRPWPQHVAMRELRESGLVTAASDNSDGILGSVWNICESSNCAAELDLDEAEIPEDIRQAASGEGVNPWNLMFFWGDWSVVATIKSRSFHEFGELAATTGIRFRVLGRMTDEPPCVSGTAGGTKRVLNIVRNENFTSTSYNTTAGGHVDHMLRAPLFANSFP